MTYTLHLGDCHNAMKLIQDNSIDLICSDFPYGKVTDFEWDTELDLDVVWKQFNRIRKENTPILLFSNMQFSKTLILSNPKEYKYEYVWVKTQAANFQLAKTMPLKKHEYILCFYKKPPTYNPQMRKGEMKPKRIGSSVYQERKSEMYLSSKPANLSIVMSDSYYPTTILDNFPSVSRNKSLHPTQKPTELIEWIIKTYSNEGDTVLDICMGSGTTIVSAIRTGRNAIGIEKEERYFEIAKKRIEDLS